MLSAVLGSTFVSASSLLVAAPVVASDGENAVSLFILILTFVKILMGMGA
jgi:hypothetical protein